MKTICVTGHRPAKLPWGYRRYGEDYQKYIDELTRRIEKYADEGVTHFISGAALGVDTDFAEAVFAFRERTGRDVTLECALPCPNQSLMWQDEDAARHSRLLKAADKVTVVCDRYYRGCMLERNMYMVDHSDIVLAVWNGEQSGGTWNTIKYARLREKRIDIISLASEDGDI